MQNVQHETNMTRAIMNTMIQWHIDMDMSSSIKVVLDSTMFDVGAFEPQVNGLYQLTLNIAANAVRYFSYNENDFTFEAGLNGVGVSMAIPYAAVLGFLIPTSEQYTAFFQIPNMERELVSLQYAKRMFAQLETQMGEQFTPEQLSELKVEPAPYAVHGIEPQKGDFDGDQFPAVADLMNRKPLAQRPAKPTPKEAAAPLLNFSNVSGTALPAPKVKRAMPEGWQVIQGGKL